MVSLRSCLIERRLLNGRRAQVKYSTTGVTDAAWKRVETKTIAYNVMTNALLQRTVVVVNV